MTPEQSRAVGAARRLIADYGVQKAEHIDVEAIAYDLGVFVIEAPLKGCWARLLRKGTGGVIRVASSIPSGGQKRFCVAHELGHFRLHENVDQLAFCGSRDMVPWYKTRPEEPEASAFAAELLMPEPLFRAQCAPGIPLTLAFFEGLAEEFQTTLTATVFRFVELGSHVCAVVASEKGEIRWSHACSDFPFRLQALRSRVDAGTCAGEFFRQGRLQKMEEDVPASAWLSDQRVDRTWTMRELMVPMPSYESALSVLWVVPGSRLDRGDD